MEGMVVTALIGLGGTAVGALATFTASWVQTSAQRRRESGTVATADAQTVFGAYDRVNEILLTLSDRLMGRLDTLLQRIENVVDTQERIAEQQEELLRIAKEQMAALQRIENGNGGTH